MFTLDSDLLGLLIALLTFFIPVITSIMEKRKKKRKEEISALQRSSDGIEQVDHKDFLPDGSMDSESFQAASVEEEEPLHTAASELEELFNDILGINDRKDPNASELETLPQVEMKVDSEGALDVKSESSHEGEASTLHLGGKEPTDDGETPYEGDKGVKNWKNRIKEHPEEAVILAEILKPKFKEF